MKTVLSVLLLIFAQKDIYKEGKALYVRVMDGVINRAAALVVRQLNAAKKRINAGKL